jgi:hypothetical protein
MVTIYNMNNKLIIAGGLLFFGTILTLAVLLWGCPQYPN